MRNRQMHNKKYTAVEWLICLYWINQNENVNAKRKINLYYGNKLFLNENKTLNHI